MDFAAAEAAHIQVLIVRRLAQIGGAATRRDLSRFLVGERAVVLHLEHPDRIAAIADVVAVPGAGLEHPAGGKIYRLAGQRLDHLAGLQIPHLHGVGVGPLLRVPLVQWAHEGLLREPGGGDHAVELGLDHRLVGMVGRLVARHELAVIGELGDAARSGTVRSGGHADQHPAGNRVGGVRPR